MNSDKNETKYEIKRKYKISNFEVELIGKYMIIISDNDYSNPCDESDNNETEIKE